MVALRFSSLGLPLLLIDIYIKLGSAGKSKGLVSKFGLVGGTSSSQTSSPYMCVSSLLARTHWLRDLGSGRGLGSPRGFQSMRRWHFLSSLGVTQTGCAVVSCSQRFRDAWHSVKRLHVAYSRVPHVKNHARLRSSTPTLSRCLKAIILKFLLRNTHFFAVLLSLLT